MSENRLGESQKDALIVLAALEERGITQINMSRLLMIINKSRLNPVHRNNFRIAIKRLTEKHLIVRKITTSLTWVIALTPQGREKAGALIKQRDRVS